MGKSKKKETPDNQETVNEETVVMEDGGVSLEQMPVYRIPVNGKGELETTSLQTAIDDVVNNSGGAFDEALTREVLAAGEAVFSETYNYSTSMELLKGAVSSDTPEVKEQTVEYDEGYQPDAEAGGEGETPSEAGETPEIENPLQEGDVIFREDKGFAEVFKNDNGNLVARYFFNGKAKQQPLKGRGYAWVKATPEQVEEYKKSLALTKEDEPIQGEVVLPLTQEEIDHVNKRIEQVREAEQMEENALLVKGFVLREFRDNPRYFQHFTDKEGNAYKNFESFAEGMFGIARAYGQNLIQLAEYKEQFPDDAQGVRFSINALNAMVRNQNKLMAKLGLSETEFNVLKPVITNTVQLLVETAKTDKGDIPITPRMVDKFSEQLESVVKTGTIDVDGRTLTLQEAVKEGVAMTAFQENVVTAAAESIRVNAATISRNAQLAYENKLEPITHPSGETRRSSGSGERTEYYTGPLPTLKSIVVEVDGVETSVEVRAMANGCVTLTDTSRWHIDESGKLVCFEYKGKKVKLT